MIVRRGPAAAAVLPAAGRLPPTTAVIAPIHRRRTTGPPAIMAAPPIGAIRRRAVTMRLPTGVTLRPGLTPLRTATPRLTVIRHRIVIRRPTHPVVALTAAAVAEASTVVVAVHTAAITSLKLELFFNSRSMLL